MSRKPTGRARELGATLRRYRLAAEWTEINAARSLRLSACQLSRIESGERGISDVNVARCLTLYGVAVEEINEVLAVAREANDGYRLKAHNDKLPDELRTLMHHETTASHIDFFEPSLIPGLLQTEDYARALLRWGGLFPEDGIELRVQARMERQRLLRCDRRPVMRFFIHETALAPQIFSSEIMEEQLLLLMLACNWRDCEIRLVPAETVPNGVFGGPFMFMRYADYHPVAYVENIRTSEFIEDATDLRVYRSIVNRLASLALPEGESRERLAAMAT
ncbi:MAG TPA: helix-turn-helix transcriptional regulator [Pseudonocardiaceae bacterium]|jgi:transcriptional regulator with XRE-family HTH domain|nr:helix-turn-helix transcriptional regulator [Pseudonocardiaceae bacterium]